jgi:carbon monoxide dehydrogenase subunit G
MKLEQSFEVNAPLERVWSALIDVERVAPCLPGAAVTARNEDGSYAGSFSVRIGPTSASYSGKLQMQELDEDAHRATMRAQGSDKRGQGGAEATIVSTLHDLGEGRTRVEVSTDYRITGRLARFGRGGMIEDISNKLLRQFADSLARELVGEAGAAGEPSAVAAQVPAEPSAAAGAAQAPAEPSAAAGAAQAPAEPSAAAAEAPGSPASPPAAPAGSPAPPPVAPSAQSSPQQAPPPTAPPGQSAAPLDASSLIGSVILERLKRNPLPAAAATAGLGLALVVLFRRR